MPTLNNSSKSWQGGFYVLLLLSFVQLLPLLTFALQNDVTALRSFLSGIQYDPTASLTSTWKQENVDSYGCPLGWYGVTCSNGRVTGLLLTRLNLSGEIRKGTLGAISELSSLYLLDNQLSGLLPDDLGSLSLLQQLDVSNNLFHGSIPSSFSNLDNLVNLTLAGNKFGGAIPDMFEKMSSLVTVDLSMNSLSGAIPPTLTLLPYLGYLNLSCNSLSGALPNSLEMPQELETLDLHSNQLSGSIDPAWINLAKIQNIDLSNNSLSGLLPWQQSRPVFSNIVYINLSHNQLSGPLAPTDASSIFANQLQVLDVSSNQLSGELPSFEFAFSLQILRLQNNSFSGSVPPALLSSDATLLEDLDLSMNNLSGELAPITASSLHTLNLSSNALSGVLPPKLGSCAVVDLSTNLFSGDLLAMQTWSNTLEVLDLSSNFLTGDLPNQTAELLRLISFNLSHNSLSGAVPPLFGYFHKLTTLDLSDNQLIGEVPTSLFQSPSLKDLRLSHNQLSGSIILDDAIASGSIPTHYVLPFSHSHATASVSLSPLSVLDLSWNDINGSIPQNIGSLAMLEVLDLSRNKLTGNIPSLSQLDHLQILDLSFNQLNGAIPVQMPVSLQGFNVSNNDLSGKIPYNVEHKFPQSSFFPGNSDLNATPGAFNSSSPTENAAGILSRVNHKRITPAMKAGLTGGCTAGLLLLLFAGLFVLYKQKLRPPRTARTSVFRVIEKGLDQSGGTGNVHRLDLSCQSDVQVAPSVTVGFSGEHLLSPSKDADAVQPKGDIQAQDNFFKSTEVPKCTTPIGMSPSRKQFTDLLQSIPKEESSSSTGNPIVLRVGSPDNLAGDLFLLDNSTTFTAEELSRAPAEVLGRSSHGTSYKATLENGHSVTVKWLREGIARSKKEFTSEAKKFGSIKHPNVMPLKGFYWGPREHEKLLLTDFLHLGSLEGRLSEKNGQMFSPLNWSQRVSIALDIANGLSYLHFEHKLPHGNLKSTNVLLDGPNLDARLTDYSLHRLITVSGTANQIVNAGALGYLAPELADTSKPKPSMKADVYAFGVILLEIFTGKGAGDIISGSFGAVSLADWVKLLADEGKSSDCFDPLIVRDDKEQNILKTSVEELEIALRCLSPAEVRPNIKTVYEELVAIGSNTQLGMQT
ncbi:hypothetical protein O6H91_18G043900 [Diphasiastrum complanatum]|uniref:Uncharacterized protein n=1 Tax=Diphasiastrum complanatum TaxID=34168 RepID=A0ACC2B0N1_DIPCM|nr:hypothetical protein O6H91_18G043900 [Diphasiastrum complanatum]